MKSNGHRLDFANSLRGIACLSVLISHYIFGFAEIHGQYDGFAALPRQAYPWIPTSLMPPHSFVSFGSLGVALFFLISGLVIPFSVDGLSKGRLPRTAFFISRAFRIVPTYAAGAFISFCALRWGAMYNGLTYDPDHAAAFFLSNISLFRDWTIYPQFDGVVWTLEVESKFYLFVMLAWAFLRKRSLMPLILLAVAAIAASPFHSTYPAEGLGLGNFIWYLKHLAFMGIGVVFHYHHRGALSSKALKWAAVALFAVFLGICVFERVPAAVPVSYGIALIVFGWLYFKRITWNGGPVVRFFADISFPLYAVHAPIGYVALRVLIGNGWSGLGAFAIVTPCVIFLAWLMHISVERFSQLIGKWLAAKLQGLAAIALPARADLEGQNQ